MDEERKETKMTKDFATLKTEVETYSADCTDCNTHLKTLRFGNDNQMIFQADLTQGNDKPMMAGKLNDWSFNQIAGRLNAPGQWMTTKYCPEEMKVTILNDLTTKYREDAEYLIRLKSDTVRAVLSNQYSRFDNLEFIDLIGEAVATMGIQGQVHRDTVGDELRAYLIFPQITFAPDPEAGTRPNPTDNGGLHPAIYISNSERGGGSAKVAGAVYRSICTNGMIFGWQTEDMFSIRHRFHSRTAMGLLVAEGITSALKMSEEATRLFIQSQDVKIPQVSLAGIVNDWANRYGISVEAKDNWLAGINAEAITYNRYQDPRLFDMVNSATYVAQTRNTNEAEQMERMAGDLLRGRTRQPIYSQQDDQ